MTSVGTLMVWLMVLSRLKSKTASLATENLWQGVKVVRVIEVEFVGGNLSPPAIMRLNAF